MTRLKTKPVQRIVQFATDWRRPEDYVVTLYPTGEIGIRRKRCKEYRINLSAVYVLAVRYEAEAAKKAKAKAKKEGKGI